MQINTICSIEACASQELIGPLPKQAFSQALEGIKVRHKSHVELKRQRILFKIAGFSLNAISRLLRLSHVSVEVLQSVIPESPKLWDSFVQEIHLILRKMDEIRKFEPQLARLYLSEDLVLIMSKLYCLRHLESLQLTHLEVSDVRIFMRDHSRGEWFVTYLEQSQSTYITSFEETLPIKSVIKLLELYCDELMAPPRFISKHTIRDCELHEVQMDEFAFEEENARQLLEAFNQFMDGTFLNEYLDELPKFDLVIDWFIASRPAMDKNQVKRGWAYLEQKSEKWRKQLDHEIRFDELITAYPPWSCYVADNLKEWVKVFPQGLPYQIVPVNTPNKLWEEGHRMKHCVSGYIGRCIAGNARIFSVRALSTGESIATVELLFNGGRWSLLQLKGIHNQDLNRRISNFNYALAKTVNILVEWYNQHVSQVEQFEN